MFVQVFRPIRAAFATLFHYLLFFVNVLGYPAGLTAEPLPHTVTPVPVPAADQPAAPAAPAASHSNVAETTHTALQKPAETLRLKLLSNVSAPTALQGMMLAVAGKNIAKQLVQLALSAHTPPTSHRYAYEFYTERGRNLALPKRVAGLPLSEVFTPRWVGGAVERSLTFLGAQVPLIARFARDPQGALDELGHDPFVAFFGTPALFPRPRGVLSASNSPKENSAHPWISDAVFARQYLVGCNPVVLHRPTADEAHAQLPAEFRSLRDPAGRNPHALAAQGALFWADYAPLAAPGVGTLDTETGAYSNAVSYPVGGPAEPLSKKFYAPFVVFYTDLSSGELGLLGFTLTRFAPGSGRTNVVYSAQTYGHKPNTYLLAKMHVACADNQLHQFYYHLCRCHLAYEPIGVAVHNVFLRSDAPPQHRMHVVSALLRPHFAGAIAVNWLARLTLLPNDSNPIPPVDASFAVGAHGGLTLMMRKFADWRFAEQAVPAALAARGFATAAEDGLRGYHYRDDALALWAILLRYVRTALNDAYPGGDAAVAADPVLHEWATEMRDSARANVTSFPARFESVEGLAQAVTTIIYNVSGEHAAVNYPQPRYLVYVPNRPNALFTAMPPPNALGDLDLSVDVLGSFGELAPGRGAGMPFAFAVFQVAVAHLLAGPATCPLTEVDAMRDVCPRAHRQLQAELSEMGRKIRDRNDAAEAAGEVPYEYLLPENVPASVEM